MDIGALFQRAGKVAAENSPAILTAIGVTGTITTAYLAAKAAFKSAVVLREAEEQISSPEEAEKFKTFQGKAELTWKLYIPAATCAALTITSIICANRVSERKAAAMATAYAFAEKSFKEYRDKNLQVIGPKKEQAVRDEIVQDRIRENPPDALILALAAQKGSTVCWDKWADRYFVSDMESIRKAVNDFNLDLRNSAYLALSEFYHLLGVRPTQMAEEVGWNSDAQLELNYTSALTEEGVPVLAIDYKNRPSHRFADFH